MARTVCVTPSRSGVRQLYDPLLVEHYDDSPARLADLDQLEIIAAGYEDRTGFLAALALEPPAATQGLASR